MSEIVIINGVTGLKEWIGKRIGPSEWIEITQARIDAFAQATGDYQWIHVDPERAEREGPFGTTIAHGYLTLALTPAIIPKLYRIDPCSLTVNAGIEKMSLKEPVKAGSRLRLFAEVKQVRMLPSGAARTNVRLTFELEGSKRPACVCDSIVVYYP
jgi:acyl dehydratase